MSIATALASACAGILADRAAKEASRVRVEALRRRCTLAMPRYRTNLAALLRMPAIRRG